MSVVAVVLPRPGWRRLTEDGLVLLVGMALLAGRPLLQGTGSALPFALVLGMLLVLSLAAGAGSLGRGPAVVWATALGLGAVAASRLWAAPGFPAPVAPAGVALSLLAAVAEEAFFRGFVYGRVVRFGAPAAIAASAAAFAAIHVPFYGAAAVWVDLGAGLLFGWQRWASNGWGAPAATHVAANLAAMVP